MSIKTYRQTLIRRAAGKGYKFAALRKKYGRVFLAKLIEHIEAELIRPRGFDNPRLPVSNKYLLDEVQTDFRNAGIPFHEWKENFIDEDTGEVVQVDRWEYQLALSVKEKV